MATQVAIELQALGPDEPLTFTQALAIAQTSGHVLGPDPSSSSLEPVQPTPKLSTSRAWIVITQLCGVNFISSFSNGLLTVGLPTLASDLSIPENLLLWPNSVFFLTGGSCLLLAGSVADVIGPRRVNLPGGLLVSIFILACGLARNSIDLIMFRAFQGLATALVVPSAVSIISTNIEHGRRRNIGFASIFLAQPIGFAIGLVLGGVLISGVGWRTGFYIGGSSGLLFWLIGIWTLPRDPKLGAMWTIFDRLAKEIDWVGAVIASASLAVLCYVLAMLSADTSHIKQPANIVLLLISLAVLASFPFWMNYQEKRGKPALIPNSLWKNHSFTAVCIMVLLSNAVINCMELFCSLFFQQVQLLDPVEASVRILPQVIAGSLLNFLAGVLVDKVPAMAAVETATVLGALSPLLMATINPAWPYWYSAFWAQILAPLGIDILLTVGTLIVSDVFPTKTQALAGAVFNTFSQLGTSVGYCLVSVIATSVTAKSRFQDKSSPQALMTGYRASFWALFAWMVAAIFIGAVGLRKLGKVGLKRD